jgi:hypothetical protein
MKDVRQLLTLIITWMITQVVVAFVPSPSTNNNNNIASSSSSSISSKLNFGFNGLGTPNDATEKKKKNKSSATTQDEEKKITTKGLFQLIAAGMGAPFLGDYEGVDGVSYNIYFQFFFRLLSLTYIPLNIYYSS